MQEEYEQLPLAKERREAELRLLKIQIQYKLMVKDVEETEYIIKMKNQIDQKREQLKIIDFAKLYVEQKKRETRYSELRAKVNSLRIQERDLRSEVLLFALKFFRLFIYE